MKKKILTLISVLSIAMLAVGCGSKKDNANNTTTVKSNAESTSSKESSDDTTTNAAEDTANNDNNSAEDNTTNANKSNDNLEADAYVGTWGCDRATLTIEKDGDSNYKATISWADSAYAHSEWEYPLTYDSNNGKMVCSGNGKNSYIEYKDENSDPEITVNYTDGSATFSLTDNAITWDDAKENSGDGMSFVK